MRQSRNADFSRPEGKMRYRGAAVLALMQIGSILLGNFAVRVGIHSKGLFPHVFHDSATDALATYGWWALLVPVGWTITYGACAVTERTTAARWLVVVGLCFALLYGLVCLTALYRGYVVDMHG
jgi:hypothetical protein